MSNLETMKPTFKTGVRFQLYSWTGNVAVSSVVYIQFGSKLLAPKELWNVPPTPVTILTDEMVIYKALHKKTSLNVEEPHKLKFVSSLTQRISLIPLDSTSVSRNRRKLLVNAAG